MQLFVAGLKSFNDYVELGVEDYKASRLDEAEQAFTQAMLLDEESYIPYYYLGLIRYAQKPYFDAAQYYENAEYGAETPLVRYALGINAYASSLAAERPPPTSPTPRPDDGRSAGTGSRLQQQMGEEQWT